MAAHAPWSILDCAVIYSCKPNYVQSLGAIMCAHLELDCIYNIVQNSHLNRLLHR